jgi:hypothetical protein
MALQRGLQTGDQDALERLVDWPRVREKLQSDLTGSFLADTLQTQSQGGSDFDKLLSATVAPTIIDRFIQGYVTPQGLKALLQKRQINGAENTIRFHYSQIRLTNIDQVTVPVGVSTNPARQVTAVFERQGWIWRVESIQLPSIEGAHVASPSLRQDAPPVPAARTDVCPDARDEAYVNDLLVCVIEKSRSNHTVYLGDRPFIHEDKELSLDIAGVFYSEDHWLMLLRKRYVSGSCGVQFQAVDLSISPPLVSENFGTCQEASRVFAANGTLNILLPTPDGESNKKYSFKGGLLSAVLQPPFLVAFDADSEGAESSPKVINGQSLFFTYTLSSKTAIVIDPRLSGQVRISTTGDMDCLRLEGGQSAIVSTEQCSDTSGSLRIEIPPMMPIDIISNADGDVYLSDTPSSLTAKITGEGDLIGGNVGHLALDVHGPGDARFGSVLDDATVDMSGSGDVSLFSVKGKLQLKDQGRGDLSIGHVDCSSIDVASFGSGDIFLGAGHLVKLIATIKGTGDLSIAASTQDANVMAQGGGDIKLGRVTGAFLHTADEQSEIRSYSP